MRSSPLLLVRPLNGRILRMDVSAYLPGATGFVIRPLTTIEANAVWRFLTDDSYAPGFIGFCGGWKATFVLRGEADGFGAFEISMDETCEMWRTSSGDGHLGDRRVRPGMSGFLSGVLDRSI